MLISAIAAVARNRVIGRDNQIPWYIPDDLKFFKRTTLGHHVIMGRKNYRAMERPLPKRTNVVITRDPFFISTGCVVVHSIEEALDVARDNGETEAFIIGGGEIYTQTADIWDRLYLTEVHADVEGDVLFPEIDFSKWNLIEEQTFEADDRNEFGFTIKVFHRLSQSE